MWVRGLKSIASSMPIMSSMSHPMWVRGLKFDLIKTDLRVLIQSHPMWVRGLK